VSDELKVKLQEIIHRIYWKDTPDSFQYVNDVIAQIDQAYQEEKHDTALLWYTRLVNDLINDDDLKRSEYVGRILGYARIAAGLSEDDVKITLPDKFIPHDPGTIVKHIRPVLEVSKNTGFIGKRGKIYGGRK
jgi:hypothetical protein